MADPQVSRRRWLAASPLGAVLLTSRWPEILAAQGHAQRAVRAAKPAELAVFSPAEGKEIEALAGQIIPADETPGAREAGVLYFIDRALATFDSDKREVYTKGLAETESKRAEMFASESIAALSAEQQIQLLEAIEKTAFFELLRTHCILGFFGDPSYGGNRNQAGWKLIGFEDSHQFAPPFGYYDGPDRPENEP